MSYLLLDDGFAEHPKVRSLDDRTFRVHVRALGYCKRFQTDGFIPSAVAEEFGGEVAARKLVAARLWEKADGGFRVHDYLQHNWSRSRIEAERKAKSEGGRKGNKKRWGAGRIAPAIAPPIASPIASSSLTPPPTSEVGGGGETEPRPFDGTPGRDSPAIEKQLGSVTVASGSPASTESPGAPAIEPLLDESSGGSPASSVPISPEGLAALERHARKFPGSLP